MMRIIRFGDAFGVGAIVEVHGWFTPTTWTLVRSSLAKDGKPCTLDRWVCRENGKSEFADEGSKVHLFYHAQYNTRGSE